MATVDYVEVGRTAHQLQRDHGHRAHIYAIKLSREAEADGKTAEAEFWKAVAAALTPR